MAHHDTPTPEMPRWRHLESALRVHVPVRALTCPCLFLPRRRTLIAIGTHDLDTIQGPFSYEARPKGCGLPTHSPPFPTETATKNHY